MQHPINKGITKSVKEWGEMMKDDADGERGIKYPGEDGHGILRGVGKGAVYDEENQLLRVTGFCRAMMAIFDREIVETTNCS